MGGASAAAHRQGQQTGTTIVENTKHRSQPWVGHRPPYTDRDAACPLLVGCGQWVRWVDLKVWDGRVCDGRHGKTGGDGWACAWCVYVLPCSCDTAVLVEVRDGKAHRTQARATTRRQGVTGHWYGALRCSRATARRQGVAGHGYHALSRPSGATHP